MRPLLELVDVEKRYPPVDEGGEGVPVLTGVSLRLDAGESVAVLGPAGAGKSTLLHIAGLLEPPDAGRVLLDGCELTVLDDDVRAEARRRDIGFVFQVNHLLPQCTALENVLVPASAAPGEAPGAGEVERARALLAAVGLGERMSLRPGQLSGCERQRVAVARALMRRPRLLLADEPTGALDPSSAARLIEFLMALCREQGLALLMATHDESLATRMRRVLELARGTLRPVAATA